MRAPPAPGELVISYDRLGASSGRGASPIPCRMPRPSGSMRRELLEIGGRTHTIEDIQGQYMGLLKFTPPAWSRGAAARLARRGGPRPAGHDGIDSPAARRQVVAISTYGTDGQWGEIDNPGDVALYQSMIRDAELTLEAPPATMNVARDLCRIEHQRQVRDAYEPNFAQGQLGLHGARCALR